MPTELCGETAPGGPCTMKKGHKLNYHRHRVYEKVYWEIKTDDKVLEVGNSRVPMNYAITRCFEEHENLTITLQRYTSNEPIKSKV
jgi:hypothetical protein